MKKKDRQISSLEEIAKKMQAIDESQSGQIKGGFLSMSVHRTSLADANARCSGDNSSCTNFVECTGSNATGCYNTLSCQKSENDTNCNNTLNCFSM